MYISPSQLDLFMSCGEAYRRKYIENDKRPPYLSSVIGISIHKGIETNFKQKIETRKDMRPEDIVAVSVAEYEAQIALDDVLLTDDERAAGAQNTVGEGKDTVVALATLHAETQAKDYQPVAVEKEMKLELSNYVMLLGYADLIDDQGRIIDFKTASRSKQQGDADKSTQLTVYAAAFEAETGSAPKALALDVLVNTKQPKRQILTTTRDRNDFDALTQRICVMLDAIDKGVFIPASPNNWLCSPNYCPYYTDCKYVKVSRR